MVRRSLLRHAGIADVLSTGQAPAVHAQSALRWRWVSSFPGSPPTYCGSAEKFSETVRDLSGVKFEVSVHAAGKLVPPFRVVDAQQSGTAYQALEKAALKRLAAGGTQLHAFSKLILDAGW